MTIRKVEEVRQTERAVGETRGVWEACRRRPARRGVDPAGAPRRVPPLGPSEGRDGTDGASQ